MDLSGMSVKISVDTIEMDTAIEKMKVLNEEMEKFIKLQIKSSSMPFAKEVSFSYATGKINPLGMACVGDTSKGECIIPNHNTNSLDENIQKAVNETIKSMEKKTRMMGI